jgi:DNA-directed RNA polymerase specialized sigma24 family protein
MVVETVFEQSYSATTRIASVRAATTVTMYGLPSNLRRDMEQEGLLELWRKRQAYDARRGCWRRFAEAIIANKVTSLVRRMRSQRSGLFREDPLELVAGLAAPNDHVDLRTDVARVLAGVSQFNRNVAVCLVTHSPTETCRRLGVSRATIYRAIARLRLAFTAAGLASSRYHRRKEGGR